MGFHASAAAAGAGVSVLATGAWGQGLEVGELGVGGAALGGAGAGDHVEEAALVVVHVGGVVFVEEEVACELEEVVGGAGFGAVVGDGVRDVASILEELGIGSSTWEVTTRALRN